MKSFNPRVLCRLTLTHYIFFGVLILRLLVLARLSGTPFLLPAGGDMQFYNDWAHRILAGEHSDHVAFYGLPGYAWLLALIYKLGVNPFLPAFIQSALDAGTAALICQISLCVFANDGWLASATGLITALAWALFVPAQTYSVVLMPTTWVVFIETWLLWRIIKNSTAPSLWMAALFGVVIGLAATAIATALIVLFLVLAAIWIKPALESWASPFSRLTATILLGVGVVAGTAPCWIHNYVTAHDPVFLSAHSGINYWIGNNPEANGYPRFPPGLHAGQAAMLQDSIEFAEAAAGHRLTRGEVSSFWSAKASDYIRRNFTSWLRLLAVKAKNFWNAFQYDDLSIITSLRGAGVTLPGIYFGLIAALALPGLVLAWTTAPRSRWIAAAIVLQFLALLPVFVTERYRLPAVPGLLIFASFGLCNFGRSLAVQNFRPTMAYAGLLILSTLFVSWPQRDETLWALDAYNAGRQALETGNLSLAERKLDVALAYVPNNAETHFALGNLNLAQHNEMKAAQFYLETLALDPQHRGALNNLGFMALDAGQPQIAEEHFRQALAVENRNPKTHFLLARSLLAQGKRDDALFEIRRALALNPSRGEFLAFERELLASGPR